MLTFEQIRLWYEQGLWTEQMLRNAVAKGFLTQAQYEQIIGQSPEKTN